MAPGGTWGDALVAGMILVVSVAVIVQWWRRRTPELWMALPFALLTPFLSSQVLHWGMNSIRAIGPAITFLALDVAAMRGATRAERRCCGRYLRNLLVVLSASTLPPVWQVAQ